MGDWPPVRNFPDLSPCLPVGLVEPRDALASYGFAPCDERLLKVQGRIETALPYVFSAGKTCICLGSSVRYADILIAEASAMHAAMLLNRRTGSWWVFDCGGETGTYVNGERIWLHELQDGDRIQVARTALAFRGNRLETGRVSSGGMSICVQNMRFSVPERPKPILDGVSFSISPGEFVGVLGPSGCGKSSLVQRLVGLSDDYEGEVYVNGAPRREVEKAFRDATAYLPQNVERSLHDALTLADEVACFRALHVVRADDASSENADCLAALGLSGREASRVGNLSGGEKRRLGIALALLRRPQFLLLDEPGAGLDPASEWTLMRHLRGIADQGRTVLCVTHELANIGMFDKVLVLSGGRVVYAGSPDGLLPAFHVTNFARLYQVLEQGHVRSACPAVPVDLSKTAFPSDETKPSLPQVFCGYLKRSALELFACVGRHGGPRLVRLLLAPAGVRLLWQPLALALGIRLACAYYFNSKPGGSPLGDIDVLGFCSSLAVFWIGMNNCVRDFVHEREPGRCLERLNGVPLYGYMLSRLVFALSVGAAQTLSFVLFLGVFGRIPMQLATPAAAPFLPVSVFWFLPLVASCSIGVMLGLAVSAMARREISAVSMVPNIAILALLFSDPIVRFETGDGGYLRLAKTLATVFMPCHWPAKVAVDIQQGDPVAGDACIVFAQLAVCAVVCAIATLWFQNRNEKAWDGR